MDYNYIRMRKAIHAGDTSLATYYKNLLDNGMESQKNTSLLMGILVCLIVISIVLGAVIGYIELTSSVVQDYTGVLGAIV